MGRGVDVRDVEDAMGGDSEREARWATRFGTWLQRGRSHVTLWPCSSIRPYVEERARHDSWKDGHVTWLGPYSTVKRCYIVACSIADMTTLSGEAGEVTIYGRTGDRQSELGIRNAEEE